MQPKELTVKELVELANQVMGRWPKAQVFFKFTCIHCGARQTFDEPNTLYTEGHCEECGNITEIVEGGFAVIGATG